MMAIRLKVAGKKMYDFENYKEINQYCKKILDFLYDEAQSTPIIIDTFNQIVNSVDYLKMPLETVTKSEKFTEYVLTNVQQIK